MGHELAEQVLLFIKVSIFVKEALLTATDGRELSTLALGLVKPTFSEGLELRP
jgi:hypothetical protein